MIQIAFALVGIVSIMSFVVFLLRYTVRFDQEMMELEDEHLL